MLEINKIHHGDCLELMKEIPDQSVDMILCDLPYGMTARNKWDCIIPYDKLWQHYNRIAKETTPFIFTSMQPFTSYLIQSNIKNFKYCWIWEKNKATGFLNSKKQPLRAYEEICVFYRKQSSFNPIPYKNEEYEYRSLNVKAPSSSNYGEYNNVRDILKRKITTARNVIRFNVVHGQSKEYCHPTQKPVDLFEYLIKTYTNEGDLILDNCGGSGTTAVACMNTGRNFLVIEKEEKYVKIARDRIEQQRIS